MASCEHCGLSIGKWSHVAEIEGDENTFCCYGCFVGWQASRGGGDDSSAVGFLIRLGVGAFLTMNIMLISLLLYTGALDGLHADLKPYAHGILWALATPAIVVLGGPFFKESAQGIAERRLVPSMLIVLGTSAAYTYSAVATLLGWDRVYFDTAAMVLVLFTLGHYLEANNRARAVRSLKPMMEAERQRVNHLLDGARHEIKIADVVPGMIIQVEPGERIPVDGIVTQGISQAQEATLTGEPHPIEKTAGSRVLAGSINGDHTLLIETNTSGLDSNWIAICRDVRDALTQPTHLQRIAEKTAVVFVPLVLIVAGLTVWLHLHKGNDGGVALLAGMAVLVVACPCALGLAAPLATSIALSRLVETGILLRNGAVLETVASLRSVALDKTGTLTTGQITCTDIVTSDPAIDSAEVLQRAAALAQSSMHPLSLSVLREISKRELSFEPANEARVIPGMGIKGTCDGDMHYLGNERWLRNETVPIVHTIIDAAEDAATRGKMVTFVAWGGVCRCLLVFDVPQHPQSGTTVNALQGSHIDVAVLTGDGQVQARQFCQSIGVSDCFAELTPNEKKDIVVSWSERKGPIAMVGDGLNDALALTAADVGIAVGTATDLTRETADVVLHTDDVSSLLPLISVAKITRQTIITNLFWAFGYNSIAIAFAVAGWLLPVIAALLMAGSSLIVVANTMFRLDDANQYRLPRVP